MTTVQSTFHALTVQRAFIQWAGFTFGRTASFVDPAGQMGDSGIRSLHQIQTESTTGANGINQIAYTWQLGNGVTFNVGADEERVRGIHNLAVGGAVLADAGREPRRQRPYRPAGPVAVGVVARQPGLGCGEHRLHRPEHAHRILHRRCGLPGRGAERHHASAQYPDNEFGFGVLSGAEFKLPWIAPGDRVLFHANYAVGAVRFATNNLQSPGLFGSRTRAATTSRSAGSSDGVYFNSDR